MPNSGDEGMPKSNPGWYESPFDPAVAQYWNGSQWVEGTRSFESLNLAALQELLELLKQHSSTQAKIIKTIRSHTNVLAWLALLSAIGGAILWINVASQLSQ